MSGNSSLCRTHMAKYTYKRISYNLIKRPWVSGLLRLQQIYQGLKPGNDSMFSSRNRQENTEHVRGDRFPTQPGGT